MRATIIHHFKPDDSSSIYHIFERLNTGGVNLNPMEIRQCIGYQPFIETLQELNRLESWRTLIGKKVLDKRLRDEELILRVMALSEQLSSYDKPMKSFLNRYVESKRKAESTFPGLKQRFEQVCKLAVSELGKKPFHLRGRLNYGLLDSVLATLFKTPAVSKLKEKFDVLTSNPTYIDNVTGEYLSDAKVLQVSLPARRKTSSLKVCDAASE